LEQITEEAIISLARATFAQGLGLVYAGRPEVALLLASVLGEFIGRRYAERASSVLDADEALGEQQFVAYVSRPLDTEQRLEDELDFMHRYGLASLHWVRDFERDAYDMIRRVQPNALVCIGGDENTRIITYAFHEIRPNEQVFVMATTGAASEGLSTEMPNRVISYDRILLDRLDANLRETDLDARPSLFVQGIPPYPLIMQDLIHTLTSSYRR
jgi:hypothetical protein